MALKGKVKIKEKWKIERGIKRFVSREIQISYKKINLPRPLGMAIGVMEFSREGYKIRKVFAWESTYPKEIFEFWESD